MYLSQYPYPGNPLKPAEIRLIRLWPGKWSDEIRCDLHNVNLRDKPQFKALSYVWGSRRVTRCILLDGKEYVVTVNLESALRHLRHLYNDLTLWIDALCINQTDIEERTQQVEQMGDIYKSCELVLVYLGDELGRAQGTQAAKRKPSAPVTMTLNDSPGDLSFVQSTFQEMSTSAERNQGHYGASEVFSLVRMLAANEHLSSSPIFTDGVAESVITRMKLFEALRQLMHTPWTPWWSRVWVIQEVSMPKDVVMVYGTVVAPWSIFARAASSYVEHSGSCCSTTTKQLPRDQLKVLEDFSRRVLDIEELRLAYSRPVPSLPTNDQVTTGLSATAFASPDLSQGLLSAERHASRKKALLPLLRRFRNRKASDPRDKIYALLSLVRTEYGYWDILPDYSISVADVYQKATLQAIYAFGSLSVLGADVGRKFRHDLPSWVPDWDAPGGYAHTMSRIDAIELYQACSQTEADPENTFPLGEAPNKSYKHLPSSTPETCTKVGGLYQKEATRYNPLFPWLESSPSLLQSSPDRAHQKMLCVQGHAFIDSIIQVEEVMWGDSAQSCSDTIWNWFKCIDGGKWHEQAFCIFWKLLCGDVICPGPTGTSRVSSIRRTIPTDVVIFACWALKSERSPFQKYRLRTLDRPLQQPGQHCNAFLWSCLPRNKDEAATAFRCLFQTPEHDLSDDELRFYIDTMLECRQMGHSAGTGDGNGDLFRARILRNIPEQTLGSLASAIMDNSIISATVSRRLFKTRNGHFGLAPAEAEVGDQVFVLKGGKTPFVLRKVDENAFYDANGRLYVKYELVGDCYVHGCMDGEVQDMHGHGVCLV